VKGEELKIKLKNTLPMRKDTILKTV